MGDRRCCFTSSTSTWEGRSFADCAAHHGAWAFVACDRCRPVRSFRCTVCYNKFQSALKRRLPELEQHQKAKVLMRPEIEALLDIDFKQLAFGSAAAGHPAIELLEEGGEAGGCLWRWRQQCPCCYDFEIPALKPAMPADFASRPPKVVEDVTIMHDAPGIDDVTGLLTPASACVVQIITLDAVLTREEELHFRYRGADSPEHENYRVVWRPPAWPPEATKKEPRWTLVRGLIPEEGPKALSLICWRKLDGVAVEHDVRTVGMAFLDCVRAAAGFHREGPSKDNILDGRLTIMDSSIRVNRVSGPFGHPQPGSSFRAIASLVTARAVSCLPCMHP